ncbi:MAG: Integrase catalytic region [Nitrospirae bacterium]|nr:Integrase catalytic region [Nitrospirota bacterium]
MPWKVKEPMDERVRLIADWRSGNYSITELSVIYGVSRKAIYKWTTRYNEHGIDGLKEQSRAPLSHPNQTKAEVVQGLIKEKLDHGNWGPKKLLRHLQRSRPEVQWPSVCTVEKWLRMYGLVKERKRRKRVPPYSEPFLECDVPNKVWSADFKGQFRMGDSTWCYPLTLSDNMSRYLLMCRGVGSPCYGDTQKWFEWAFRKYGLPAAIRTDNGIPFAGRGITGLSRLSVWWIRLGIRPERIECGKPQQNGRHERMHRTLKEETATPAMADMNQQQMRFEEFRREYNNERPHEALGMKTPSSVYEASSMRYPEKVLEPQYDEGVDVRRVRDGGEISFRGNYYFLSEVLSGERVGLTELYDGRHEVRFSFHPIGIIDLKEMKVRPTQKKVLPMSVG